MVPKTGLEPARLSALPPQGSESTNFSTWAGVGTSFEVAPLCTISMNISTFYKKSRPYGAALF